MNSEKHGKKYKRVVRFPFPDKVDRYRKVYDNKDILMEKWHQEEF